MFDVFSRLRHHGREEEIFFVKCQKCGDRLRANVHDIEAHSKTCSSVSCRECGQLVGASIDAIEQHSVVCPGAKKKWSWFSWRYIRDQPCRLQPSSKFADNSVSTKASDHGLKTIVIDNGSGVCKAGFAGHALPSSSFPSLVGCRRRNSVKTGGRHKDHFVGKEVLDVRDGILIRYPIEHGIISDWEGMANIWLHTFYDELRVDPGCCRVLLTEAPMSPKAQREKLASIMFEQLGVASMCMQLQAVLSLYATGRTTGLFLDSGDGVSHTVPIFEGFAIPHAINRINFGGRDVTAYLALILKERGYHFSTPSELEDVRVAKESICYVAMDFDKANVEIEHRQKRRKTSQDTAIDQETSFCLPGGQTIVLGNERFRCAEALFQPHIAGKELPGVQELVQRTISLCDIDLRKDLYEGVVLSGGSTAFPFFDKRLESDLKTLCPPALQHFVKVLGPQERVNSVWRGGAILAALPAFEKNWVLKEDYFQRGPTVIHRGSVMV